MIRRTVNRRNFLSRTAIAAAAATLPRLAHAANSPLSEHRIERIEFRNVSVPWPRQVGRNSSKDIHGHGPARLRVCVLHTDQGASGWGQTQGNTGKSEKLLELVKGKTVGELIDPAKGIRSAEYHAIDIPLHDLAGVILHQPVWAMTGAEKPHLTKVYSGMIYFDDLDPVDNPAGIDKVLENCRWDYDHGYRQLKVKIGRGNKWMSAKAGLRRDIDVVNAIHEAFPDVDILVDGNNGFTVETMIAFLEGIADVPLFWIEEPFHETIADWIRLRDYLVTNGRKKTLRADGEAKPDFPVLEELQKDHTLNVRLEDICGHGFTKWRGQMPRLRKQGIGASPHTWGTALKTVYTAHFVGAYDRDVYITFYADSRTEITLDDVGVKLQQQTAYPNDGEVSLVWTRQSQRDFEFCCGYQPGLAKDSSPANSIATQIRSPGMSRMVFGREPRQASPSGPQAEAGIRNRANSRMQAAISNGGVTGWGVIDLNAAIRVQ